SQDQRMGKIMKRILSQLSPAEIALLDCVARYLGLHSPRKGACSYCGGLVGGPDYCAICLRGGWSLGDVRDRYHFPQTGSDQFVGRAVVGLPFHSNQFAVLPPHFDASTLSFLEEEGVWPTILPLYGKYPQGFSLALPFLLASLIHHEPFLRATLSPQHALFHCP